MQQGMAVGSWRRRCRSCRASPRRGCSCRQLMKKKQEQKRRRSQIVCSWPPRRRPTDVPMIPSLFKCAWPMHCCAVQALLARHACDGTQPGTHRAAHSPPLLACAMHPLGCNAEDLSR